MGKLLEELKRRKIFRVAAVYAVVAWVLIQVADTVLPALQMPQWGVSFVSNLFILGFPIALILAWGYEITPGGIKPDTAILPTQAITNSTDRKLIYSILGFMILVAGIQVGDRFIGQSAQINAPAPQLVSSSGGVIRTKIDLGEMELTSVEHLFGNMDISPDGSLLV